MKKLICLSLFVLGVFAVSQAQITVTLVNKTNLTWSYRLSSGMATQTLTVGPNDSVTTTFSSGITVPCNWRAATGSCSVSGVHAGAFAPTTSQVPCLTQATYITQDMTQTGNNPDTYQLNVAFTY